MAKSFGFGVPSNDGATNTGAGVWAGGIRNTASNSVATNDHTRSTSVTDEDVLGPMPKDVTTTEDEGDH